MMISVRNKTKSRTKQKIVYKKGKGKEQNHSGELEITCLGDLVKYSTGYFGKHTYRNSGPSTTTAMTA